MKTFITYGRKNLRKIFTTTILFVFLHTPIAISSIISTVKNGNWNQKDVWNLNSIPVSSDQIIINNDVNLTSDINISISGRLIINNGASLMGIKNVTIDAGAEILNYGILSCDNIKNNGNFENYYSVIAQTNFDNNSTLFNSYEIIVFNNLINNGGTISGVDGYLYTGNNLINNALGYISNQSICSIDGIRNPLISNSGTYDENTVHFCKKHTSLPVKLLSFDASPDKGQINLKFKTATEINCGFFCLQKSIDGVNFNTIESITAKGNSIEIQEYFSIDENPQNGTNYYRLTETDIDGKTEIISTIAINFKNSENKLNIYPNPTTGILNISGGNDFESVEIQIFSIDGKQILNKELNQNSINLESLNSGIYFVKIYENSGEIGMQKITKK